MIKIAIDAMGGDFGASPIVAGVLDALKERDFHAILVGDEAVLKPLIPLDLLVSGDGDSKGVSVYHASEVIEMSDGATDALKRKESSIYKAVELVKAGEAAAVVSAGHSGATMSLATLRIGRLKNISRPAIATLMPTCVMGKKSLVLDVGANVDCKSENLFEFAIMGEAYAKEIQNIQNPKIGLLSNGEEDSKGNELTKEAFNLLKPRETFIGNVEGPQIFDGSTDVIVCDGFVGNVMLKTSEGVAGAISKIIKQNAKKSPLAIIGALFMRGAFRALKSQTDYDEYGGAPLLGVNGCVIISHGKSSPKAIKNAIFQALKFSTSNINEVIETERAK